MLALLETFFYCFFLLFQTILSYFLSLFGGLCLLFGLLLVPLGSLLAPLGPLLTPSGPKSKEKLILRKLEEISGSKADPILSLFFDCFEKIGFAPSFSTFIFLRRFFMGFWQPRGAQKSRKSSKTIVVLHENKVWLKSEIEVPESIFDTILALILVPSVIIFKGCPRFFSFCFATFFFIP